MMIIKIKFKYKSNITIIFFIFNRINTYDLSCLLFYRQFNS